jgi:hypothetical protein
VPISDIKIPSFKYFPTQQLETQGPKQWARIRLLQACEKLEIPQHLWPDFDMLSLTPDYEQSIEKIDPFFLPPFQMLHETEAEWKDRARTKFEEFLEAHAADLHMMFQGHLDSGRLTRIKPVRGTTPIELRYEWAAKRYCLNTPYRKLAHKGFSEDRIKQAVLKILRTVGLKGK